METYETLLRDYAAADEDRRLSMFFAHRGLRREFMVIQTAEWRKAKVGTDTAEPSFMPETVLRRAADFCWGWLRYCRLNR